MAAAAEGDVRHAAAVHVDASLRQHVARARVAVHVAAENQVDRVIVEEPLQLVAQVLCAA